MNEVEDRAKELGELLKDTKRTLAIAESCTGGAVSHIITNMPGSSEYFLGGIISYSDESKKQLLGLSEETLARHGAVSAETVVTMAVGVRKLFGSDLGLAISGIAGPGGGTEEKPVGLVFMAIDDGESQKFYQFNFGGERIEVKRSSVLVALDILIEKCKPQNQGELLTTDEHR